MTDQQTNPYPVSGEILDGKYRVEKLLGEGGMGAVARATHLLLHRAVAVKFMNPQFMTFPGAVERFLNEGRASGVIKSDHVVPVIDVGCLPSGTPYLVMECLYGLDLADLLARDGPGGLPVQRAIHFVMQILRGLQAAHAIGIIHRDMKPSNCFVVTQDGQEDFVKILDFGISKIAQPGSASLTQTNSALGTPLYMSPEQARSPRDVDARSDLYSVGVILYELLSGHTPFFSESGEFTEILFQLFTADPPPIKTTRPDLSDELAAVVHKALAREVPDRYASALEFAEALIPFAGAQSFVIVDRMRAYQPPSMQSIVPMDGLPTSMAAFSQLQKHGTDVMVNRPTTDVQKGAPVTEVLANAPGAVPAIRAHTEVLPPQAVKPPTPVTPSNKPAIPELFEARASQEDALKGTQLGFDPTSPKNQAAAQTGGGATRDVTESRPSRSPLVFLLPLAVVAALVGGVGYVAFGKKDPPPKVVTTSEPPPSTAALAAVPSSPPAVSTPASSVPPADSVATAADAGAGPAVTAKTAPRPNQPPPPNNVLGTGFHN